MLNKIIIHLLRAAFSLAILTTTTLRIAQAQEKQMDFSSALKQVKTENKAMKSAKLNERYYKLHRKAARGLYMPRIDLLGNFTHLDNDIAVDLSETKEEAKLGLGQLAAGLPAETVQLLSQIAPAIGAMVPNEIMIQEQNLSFMAGNLLWPLFTGGKITAANKKAVLEVTEAEHATKATEEKLITELVERYYGLRLAKEVVLVRKHILDAMQQHLDDAKKLQNNGMIAQAERLHAEVSRADAFRELQDAESKVHTLTDALQNTLADSVPILPTSPLFMVEQLEPLAFFQQEALANNINLHMVDSKQELAHLGTVAARSNYMPTIAANAYYRIWMNKDESYLPDWLVGLSFTWNLFDGTARTHKYLAAKKMEERVSTIKSKAEEDIKTLVTKRYNEMLSHKQQLDAMEATEKFATEYVRIRQKAFRDGFATSTEVVDAQLMLSKVQIGKLKIMYDFDVALANLLQAAGLSHQFETYCQKQ